MISGRHFQAKPNNVCVFFSFARCLDFRKMSSGLQFLCNYDADQHRECSASVNRDPYFFQQLYFDFLFCAIHVNDILFCMHTKKVLESLVVLRSAMFSKLFSLLLSEENIKKKCF